MVLKLFDVQDEESSDSDVQRRTEKLVEVGSEGSASSQNLMMLTSTVHATIIN